MSKRKVSPILRYYGILSVQYSTWPWVIQHDPYDRKIINFSCGCTWYYKETFQTCKENKFTRCQNQRLGKTHETIYGKILAFPDIGNSFIILYFAHFPSYRWIFLFILSLRFLWLNWYESWFSLHEFEFYYIR